MEIVKLIQNYANLKKQETQSLKSIFSMVIIMLINNCSSYGSNFKCKVPKGTGCIPLSKVNKMVNESEKEVSSISNFQIWLAPYESKGEVLKEKYVTIGRKNELK